MKLWCNKIKLYPARIEPGLGIHSFAYSLKLLMSFFTKSVRSESLSSLFKKELQYVSDMIRANHSQKRANNLKNSHFLYVFPLFTPKSKSFPSLFTKERLWAICLDPSCQKSNGNDELFFTGESLFRSQKNELMAQKTDERIPNLRLSPGPH